MWNGRPSEVIVCMCGLYSVGYYIIENNRWNNKNSSPSLALHLYCFLFSAFAFYSFSSLFMKTSTISFGLHDVDACDFVSSTQFPCMNFKLCQFFAEHAAFFANARKRSICKFQILWMFADEIALFLLASLSFCYYFFLFIFKNVWKKNVWTSFHTLDYGRLSNVNKISLAM